MNKTPTAAQSIRLLGQYRQAGGEIPPADLLDPETFRLFVNQISRRVDRKKESAKTKR